MNKLNDIYVINLEYAKDRLNNIDKSFKNNNLKYNVFKAIDGKKLIVIPQYFHPKLLRSYALQNLNNYGGSIACSLSHYSLWKKIDEYNEYNDMSNILILEDDSTFDGLFKERIEYYTSKLPQDWDILYLGRKYLTGKQVGKYFIKGGKTDKKGYNASSFAYVIRKKSCKKLCNIIYPLKELEQDLTLRQNMDKFNAYFLINPIVTRNNFKSCISMNNMNNRW
jgi:GR25 family glycosyltransferase involved in LPS biosynthesis